MSTGSGFRFMMYVLVFLSAWGILACIGGEWTKTTFRDLCVNILVFVVALTCLTLEAIYGGA